jgi:chromosome segregation ATPase
MASVKMPAINGADHSKKANRKKGTIMNADELKQLGITDENVIKQVIISHGKDIEGFKKTNEELAATKADLESKLGQTTEQIKAFQDMKPEELQTAVKDWQSKYEQAQAEKANAINQLKFDTAIENALRDAKAKNLKAARAMLDDKDLKLGEDGNIEGLKERVEKIVGENSWAFGESATAPKPPRVVSKTTSLQPEPDDKMDRIRREAAGLPVGKGK